MIEKEAGDAARNTDSLTADRTDPGYGTDRKALSGPEDSDGRAGHQLKWILEVALAASIKLFQNSGPLSISTIGIEAEKSERCISSNYTDVITENS